MNLQTVTSVEPQSRVEPVTTRADSVAQVLKAVSEPKSGNVITNEKMQNGQARKDEKHMERLLDQAEKMASVCRSRPFDLDAGTVLSLWRGLHLQQYAWVYHYTVHDTCSWILRLHDDRDGRVLATLDSVGYLPAQITQWGEYPGIFGIDNSDRFSYGTLTYNLGAWAERGVDRAYVSVSVVIHGEGGRGCTIRDQTLEERISSQMQKKDE